MHYIQRRLTGLPGSFELTNRLWSWIVSFVYHARRAQAQYSARFSYPYYFVFVPLVLSLAYLKYRP